MKNIVKLIGSIALVAALIFSFSACGDGSGGKQDGATVAAPTDTSSITSTSITLNAVAAPDNGQTVEYAVNTENTAPTTGWQDNTTFDSLTASTDYWFFARAKENATYKTGAASAGYPVPTPAAGTLTGATVDAPTGTSSVTSTSITLNAVAAPDNGQTVQYAKNTENTAPTTGWQDSATFGSLTASTDYWFFARAKENTTYKTGEASAGYKVTTLGPGAGKQDGATVAAPTGTSLITSTSITLNAVAAPGNGQTVEYAINIENTAPTTGWHDSITFDSLTASTDYWFFARAKENTTYKTGEASAGYKVTTLGVVLETKVIYENATGSQLHFGIAKSGDRAYSSSPKADMDYDCITPGGYIEVTYTGDDAPVLGFYALNRIISKFDDIALVEGEDSETGVRRYNSDDILDAIEEYFGYKNEDEGYTVGSRDPTIAFEAGLRISRAVGDGATTVTKIAINYDKNHSALQTFDTLEQMQKAANTQTGNTDRIKTALEKAKNGDPITVVFLGGSITEAGSGKAGYVCYNPTDSIQDDGYANKVANWLVEKFPQSAITYVNHGSGGVGSGGGRDWLDAFTGDGASLGGLLKGPGGQARTHEPDIVFLEFAVNDSMSGWTGGDHGPNMDYMIGRILEESGAGVIVLTSLDFYSGVSADVVHSLVAAKHDVPVVNHRAALWPNLRVKKLVPVHGNLSAPDVPHDAENKVPIQINTQGLAYDHVHPNPTGHSAYASFITYFLEQIKNSLE
ncbi:MAG: SGNH/GDSL hydrolase family protein [Treponema sp.]|jgi:lysophospholipase L1-like esterase|nr:SGNH/GDSL hydrolase family protein [Treponema sp.]